MKIASASLALFLIVALQDNFVDWRKAIDDGDFAAFKRLAESRRTLKESLPVSEAFAMEAAVSRRNLRVVRYLQSRGVALTIEEAAELDDLPRVRQMLREKPWLAKLPHAPLFGAAINGDLEMTKLLLQDGADPNVDYGFINVVDFTPLSEALSYRYHEAVAIELLKHGARPHVAGGKNNPDIVPGSLRGGREPLVRAMLASRANPYSEGGAIGPPLQSAAMSGDTERIKLLLKLGVDPNRASRSFLTPLLAATMTRKRAAAEALLEGGAKLDVYSAAALGKKDFVLDAVSHTPKLLAQADAVTRNPLLYYAAMSGDAAFVRELLRRGADPRQPCHPIVADNHLPSSDPEWNEAQTHLLAAVASFAKRDVILSLLEELKYTREEMKDALQSALRDRQWDATAAILSHVSIKDFSPEQLQAIVESLPSRISVPGVRLLLNAGLDTNLKLPNAALLDDVLRRGDDDAAALLIDKGAKIGFEAAVRLGRVDLVKQFLTDKPSLASQAFPYQRDGENTTQTPFDAAAVAGRASVLRVLLGPKPSLSKQIAGRLVYRAATEGHSTVLEVLAGSGADVATALRAEDWWEPTIVVAVYNARPQIVRWLITRKIDLNVRESSHDGTPLHKVLGYSFEMTRDFDDPPDRDPLPKGKRWAEIFIILLNAGADVNARDGTGQTPLHVACNGDNIEAVRELLNRGADATIEDNYGRRAIDTARLSGQNILCSSEHRAEIIALLQVHSNKASKSPTK